MKANNVTYRPPGSKLLALKRAGAASDSEKLTEDGNWCHQSSAGAWATHVASHQRVPSSTHSPVRVELNG